MRVTNMESANRLIGSAQTEGNANRRRRNRHGDHHCNRVPDGDGLDEGGKRMTQEQREKLVYCTGLLSGLQWVVESNSVAEALQSVQEDIEMLLKEDGKDES